MVMGCFGINLSFRQLQFINLFSYILNKMFRVFGYDLFLIKNQPKIYPFLKHFVLTSAT